MCVDACTHPRVNTPGSPYAIRLAIFDVLSSNYHEGTQGANAPGSP